MSLEELMKPQDTPVTVGVLSNGQTNVPVYLVDFGKAYGAAHDMMQRYHKISLDIQPSPNGVTYYVTSDKMVTELTPEALLRALAAAPEQMLTELTRSGTPEFSSCIEISSETDATFREARKASAGIWFLIVLTESATEVILRADDTVHSVTPRRREDYVRSDPNA